MYRATAAATLALVVLATIAALPVSSLDVGDALIYQLDLRMKASGIGIMDVNMGVAGTVKMTLLNITEDYITLRVEPNLVVEGLPPEYSDIADEMNRPQTITVPTYGALGPLSEEGGAGLNDLIAVIQEQLQLLGFNETNVEVSEVSYNGIPAIKLEISLNATNYLGSGSNVEMHALSYMDMSTLALLHGEATAKFTSYTGGFEYSYKITLTNPDVLRRSSLTGYEVVTGDGGKISMIFAAEGLSVSEPNVREDRVSFTVTGNGIGSIIIKAAPGTPDPSIYIDGSQANKYKITTALDGTIYYKVPIKFSQHEVDVVLSSPITRVAAIKLNLPTEGGTWASLGSSYTAVIIILAAVAAVAVIAAAFAIKMTRSKGAQAQQPSLTEPPAPPPPPQPS